MERRPCIHYLTPPKSQITTLSHLDRYRWWLELAYWTLKIIMSQCRLLSGGEGGFRYQYANALRPHAVAHH